MTELWAAIGVLVVWNMLQAWRIRQLSKSILLLAEASNDIIDAIR